MKPKKQHYVPQFLLRNFATGRKNKAKIWVLDKKTETVYPASIKDVAHENFFYEYHGDAGHLEYENLMQKIDSIGGRIIGDITSKGTLPGSAEDRSWLSYYIAAQMIRTPTTRGDMENFRQIVIKAWGKDIKAHPDDPKTIGEYGPEDAKASSLQLLKDVPAFAKLLQEKVWFLCEASPSMPYIVSDNPVVRHNMIDPGPRGNLGLKNDGIEVYMPLSPKFAIHATCKKLAAAVLVTPELSSTFTRALVENKPIQYKPENIEFANSLQVIWAERFIFAKEQWHLDMPLDMLHTNPELKGGPGVRQKPEMVSPHFKDGPVD